MHKPIVRAKISKEFNTTAELIKANKLHTVCEECACPNAIDCWSKKHAAFLIMGNKCTRACAFCNIENDRPLKIDINEPQRIANSVKILNLKHVVVTSVTRDDLPDGGASHFADTINAIRKSNPHTTIEVLIPDLQNTNQSGNRFDALQTIMNAEPDVLNHNIETAPRLYAKARAGANYYWSLRLLDQVKDIYGAAVTKSGIMVGLGEDIGEIKQVMRDLRAARVDILTIGQYEAPTQKHYKKQESVTLEQFKKYEYLAYGYGFAIVSSSPLTRSSYHADEAFERFKSLRYRKC